MEDASYLDLKDTLIKVLEQKGFMEKLRAEVRAELFHEVSRARFERQLEETGTPLRAPALILGDTAAVLTTLD